VPGALRFSIGSLLAALWAAGSVMEYAAVDVATKIFWVKVQAIWQLPTVTAITCFTLEYTWPGRWLTRRNLALLSIAPLLFLGLTLTNNLHHLLWTGFRFDGIDPCAKRCMLENRKRVVVYGNSLNMAGIAASLKVDASLSVVCIDPHALTARQHLDEINPAAIAFDLRDPSSDLDLTLLRARPDLLLIGVDPSSDEVLILSGQFTRKLSGRDLAGLVSGHAAHSNPMNETERNR
jgi:hypothetical protein